MTNCATTPASTDFGCCPKILKSDGLSVSPMPNIITPRSQVI